MSLGRLMMKSAILCFAVVASASPTDAQNKASKPKANFSGTWLLDVKKTNSVGLTSRPDLPIKISHEDPQLSITLASESNGQIVERNFVYFTDGRGEENQATAMLTTNPGLSPRDLQKERTKSTTRWSGGNKIVTRALLQLQAGGRMLEFELVEEWKLSSNGKTLTQTTKTVYLQSSGGAFIPAMAPDKKRVYTRL